MPALNLLVAFSVKREIASSRNASSLLGLGSQSASFVGVASAASLRV